MTTHHSVKHEDTCTGKVVHQHSKQLAPNSGEYENHLRSVQLTMKYPKKLSRRTLSAPSQQLSSQVSHTKPEAVQPGQDAVAFALTRF